MDFPFHFSRADFKMMTAICANLVAAWLIAMLATRDPLVLTGNALLAMIFWRLGVKAEETLEEL